MAENISNREGICTGLEKEAGAHQERVKKAIQDKLMNSNKAKIQCTQHATVITVSSLVKKCKDKD